MSPANDTPASSPTRRVRTRFAPSPTGSPHVGTLRTGMFSWLLARHFGGDFILRIEDTDQARLVPGALKELIESFRALGLDYDEGPDRASVAALDKAKYGEVPPAWLLENGGAHGPYFQSQRLTRYREIAESLVDAGRAYYDFESAADLGARRAAIEAEGKPFTYARRPENEGQTPAEMRARAASGAPYAIRFSVPKTGVIRVNDVLRGVTDFDAATQQDFIILKADGYAPYHLAATVDDHDMEISHVLRGEEWQSSTPKHISLYEALGWEPPIIIHTANINGPDGKKLAKRDGAKGILGFINEGYLPEALFNFLALVGWSPGDDTEIMDRREIICRFDTDGLSRSPAVFDLNKLSWMNGVYIRRLAGDDLLARVIPILAAAGKVPAEPDAATRAYIGQVVALEQERLKRLEEVTELTDFFFADLPEYLPKGVDKWLRKDPQAAAGYLSDLQTALAAQDDWGIESLEATTRAVGARHSREKGELTHPVRVAITGREVGPGLFETMAVLGKGRTLRRLARALEIIHGGI